MDNVVQLKINTLPPATEAYLAGGLCALPARRAEKRPAVGRWKQYQTRMPTAAELRAWQSNRHDAVCLLCGRASGHLECIDFDAGGELFSEWWERVPPELRDRLVVQETPSGGCHVIYRCESPICGNLKLAQRRVDVTAMGDETPRFKILTLIETRGEGGLFLCAPTAGYELIQGDLSAPPVITEAERDVLLQAAWELNEHMPPVVNGPASSVAQGELSADNSHNGDCPSDNGHSRQTTAEPGREFGQAGLSAPHTHGSADNSHRAAPATGNAHTYAFPQENATASPYGRHVANTERPGDDFNARGDVRAVLQEHGWVCVPGRKGTDGNEYWRRPGKDSGWSATLKGGVFYVFSSNASPFEPNQSYAPFAVYALLTCGGDYEQAARSLRERGFGNDSLAEITPGLDISAIAKAYEPEPPEETATVPDPGPMPAEMLHVPGFVAEVMDHCLATAPYPNRVMAFCGALSLLAFLAGRKVRDAGDNRTNVYLLGLAHSAAGKDHPRKLNTRIVNEVGLADCLGERFASGEGIQDALFRTPSMLFQTDEIDGMLQSINKAKDGRHENVMGTLLTMYSSANSVYPMRRKASKEPPGVIDQPNLVIFGTAIPNHYYEALSERMLTNGFFARMIILEAGPRSAGQEPTIRELPPRVVATAKWWADFRPGTGNLENWHPVPRVIGHTPEARNALVECRKLAEAEYSAAESRGDPVGTTVWGRVSEQTRKLALLHAVSENHETTHVGLAAIEWASAFVMHQTRRMLFMAASHVADNDFDALMKRTIEILRKWRDKNGPEAIMPTWELRRRLKQRPSDFKDIVLELEARHIALFETEKGTTKPKSGCRLL